MKDGLRKPSIWRKRLSRQCGVTERCLLSFRKDALIRKQAMEIDRCLKKFSLSGLFLENWLFKYLDRLIKYF